jgi:hypothetical protein
LKEALSGDGASFFCFFFGKTSNLYKLHNYFLYYPLIKLINMKKLLLLGVLVLAVFSTSMAQTRQVTGKVTASEDGAALPGVSVSLKGSSRGTTTAADGTYKISVGDGAAITFSFVGCLLYTSDAADE